jgi:hypothetical protein
MMFMAQPNARTRDHPGVLRAFGVGMVWCKGCQGIHIDFVDDVGNIIATGFVTPDVLFTMISDVEGGERDERR